MNPSMIPRGDGGSNGRILSMHRIEHIMCREVGSFDSQPGTLFRHGPLALIRDGYTIFAAFRYGLSLRNLVSSSCL